LRELPVSRRWINVATIALLVVVGAALLVLAPILDPVSYQAVAAGIQAFGIVATLLFVGTQINQSYQATERAAISQEDEASRRRRQATIDAYVTSQEYRAQLTRMLPWNDRDPAEVASLIERAKEDPAILGAIRYYVNFWENLAVGVEQGVYDIRTVHALASDHVEALAQNFKPYIDARRQELHAPTLYIYLERMAERISSIGPIRPEQLNFND
jgi:hypothetical protein